jgi:WhiB family redox-sensing transcriptional regulator
VQEVGAVPVAVVRPRDEVIDEEHEYLFRSDPDALQGPRWALAACRDAFPVIFVPISTSDTVTRAQALAYCRDCEIRAECLRTALQDRSIVGIWGGTDEVERQRLRRRHAS